MNGLRLKCKTSAPSERIVSWIERMCARRARKFLKYHSAVGGVENFISACADHIPVSNAQKAENSPATASMRDFIQFLIVRRDIKFRETPARWQIRANLASFWAGGAPSKSEFLRRIHRMEKIFNISWANVSWRTEFRAPECGIVSNSILDGARNTELKLLRQRCFRLVISLDVCACRCVYVGCKQVLGLWVGRMCFFTETQEEKTPWWIQRRASCAPSTGVAHMCFQDIRACVGMCI